MGMNYLDSIVELQKQTQMLTLENEIDAVKTGTGGIANDYYGLDASAANLGGKAGRRFSEFPMKICHYFNKGFCKHGTSCRFYHGQVVPENFSQMYGNDDIGEDRVISTGSLAQLESEIIELLITKGGSMSIASLPMVYYDKYKKVLQADGYLTESQGHGYFLTLMQKEDFARNISASQQIYLTFPADSTFTKDDVSNHFNTFGSVADVRFPNHQRRMFGFVSFVHSETVKTVLGKGNPHCIQGSQVRVKPYQEKAKVNERKYPDRIEHPVSCSPRYVDINTELSSIPRSFGNRRSIRRQLQLIEEEQQEQALELQRRSLAQLSFAQKSFSSSPHFGFSMDESRISDDHFNFQPAEESFSFPLHTDSNYSDEDSNQGLNLPDSPFAFVPHLPR